MSSEMNPTSNNDDLLSGDALLAGSPNMPCAAANANATAPDSTESVRDATLSAPTPYRAIGSTALPNELAMAIERAADSSRYLIAVWHVANGTIYLHRQLNGFPAADLSNALQLLQRDLTPSLLTEGGDTNEGMATDAPAHGSLFY